MDEAVEDEGLRRLAVSASIIEIVDDRDEQDDVDDYNEDEDDEIVQLQKNFGASPHIVRSKPPSPSAYLL